MIEPSINIIQPNVGQIQSSNYILLAMGSSLNSDADATIFLTLNKPFYYAGQMVQGVIHINCQADRLYQALRISIKGKQKIRWTDNSGKHSTTYTNYRETYYDEAVIIYLNVGLIRGQYDYPFALLTPAALPSSFRINSDNFIRYSIAGSLMPSNQRGSIQMFKKTLPIRQPFRGIPRNLMGQVVSQSKCCNCCCSCGYSQISLFADVSYLWNGQVFHVRGQIDSSRSKSAIDNYKIVLRERTTRITQGQRVNVLSNDMTLYAPYQSISLGTSKDFSAQIKIPDTTSGYTAIGNIISRAYFLTLVCEVACCYSNPNIELHTVLLSTIPSFEQQQNPLIPADWNPMVAQPVAITSFQPYLYMPSRFILVNNQSGQVVRVQDQMGANYNQLSRNQLDRNLI